MMEHNEFENKSSDSPNETEFQGRERKVAKVGLAQLN